MKRPPSVAIIPILLLLTVVAAGALWRLGDLRSQQGVQTIESKLVELGGAFALTDQDGMRRTDADFRVKYMLVFFGYTFCPDVCPTTLAVQAEALKILGGQATRIVPVFITVDPKRDTPEVLKSYLAAFGPDFIGLSGDEAEITQVTKAYRVFYQAHAEEGDNYTVDHSGVVYLMSPEGKFVANYSLDTSPDMMAADLRRKTRAVR